LYPHAAGRYELKVFDLAEWPDLLEGLRIVASPTLIRTSPAPAIRVIGDLSERARVIEALGLDE